MLKEIAKQLADNVAGFTIGITLQVGYIDETAPKECTVIIDDEGGESNFFLPDKKTQTLRFISRHENQNTARVNSYKIYDYFAGLSQITLPEVTAGEKYILNTADAESAPVYIGRDEKELHLYELFIEFDIKDYDT